MVPQSDSSLLPPPFLEVLLGHCILKLPRTIQELSYQYKKDSYMTKEIPSLRVSVSRVRTQEAIPDRAQLYDVTVWE